MMPGTDLPAAPSNGSPRSTASAARRAVFKAAALSHSASRPLLRARWFKRRSPVDGRAVTPSSRSTRRTLSTETPTRPATSRAENLDFAANQQREHLRNLLPGPTGSPHFDCFYHAFSPPLGDADFLERSAAAFREPSTRSATSSTFIASILRTFRAGTGSSARTKTATALLRSVASLARTNTSFVTFCFGRCLGEVKRASV